MLPFCSRDKPLAVKLAGWIAELGGVSVHDCLLAVAVDTTSAGVIEPLQSAFKRVAEFSVNDKMVSDRAMYVWCANMMWKRTAKRIAAMNEPAPWLWLEPDVTPLPTPTREPSWLDQIDAGYKIALAAGKPFMHDLIERPGSMHNSGIGVYPANVGKYTSRMWQLANVPWDVFFAPDFLPYTHHTPLLHERFYAEGLDGAPPTFPDAESLEIIEPGAVLFHRCKDGSLIDRLREARDGLKIISEPVDKSIGFVVFDSRKQGELDSSGPHKAASAGSIPAPATNGRGAVTIIGKIRAHVQSLAKLAAEKPSRGTIVLEELRKARLAPRARRHK